MSEHKNVFAALAKAKLEIERVPKKNRNAEQRYDFSSIDDFMAMVGPICAANGLVTLVDEVSREFLEKPGKYSPSQWVSMVYSITTYHVSGESLPCVTRHIEVIRNGPQAYGAAQSYVLKQYYRGLLDIPTGDKDDPDFGTVQEEAKQTSSQSNAQDSNGTEAIAYLQGAKDVTDLASRWGNLPPHVQAIPSVLSKKNALKDEFKAKLTPPLQENNAAPYVQDEIPYQN